MSTVLLVVQVVAELVWARRRDWGEAIVTGVAFGAIVAAVIILIVAYGTLGR